MKIKLSLHEAAVISVFLGCFCEYCSLFKRVEKLHDVDIIFYENLVNVNETRASARKLNFIFSAVNDVGQVYCIIFTCLRHP